jgi:hypothetical protein
MTGGRFVVSLVAVVALVALAPNTRAQPPAPASSATATGKQAARMPERSEGAGANETPRTPERSEGAGANETPRTRVRSFTDVIPCSGCHNTTAWRAKSESGEEEQRPQFDHSATGFPLTGQHIHAPCVACHNASRVIKRACVSCHEDFHRGLLMQSCDACHSPAGWKVTQPIAIHRMTRFPLTGMHVLADCTECHVRASEHHWTETPIDCYGCHQKDYERPGNEPVHIGTATTPPLPRDCSLCHRAIAWVPAVSSSVASPLARLGSPLQVAPPPGHDLRFPIGFGVHRLARCDDCHASLAVPRAVRCVGCHAHDPVQLVRQHRQPIGTDGPSCLTCHPGGIRR